MATRSRRTLLARPARPTVGRRGRLAATLGLVAVASGCAPAVAARPTAIATSAAGAAGLAALPPAPLATAFTRPLAPAERAWLDATLARLSLRDRVAQLVTVWVLGDYAHVQDSSFARAREWIVRDHVGGMVMSLGSPLETAAKVNALQKLAMANGPGLPLLVSSDVEPGLGRLEGGVYVPYLWSAGTATVLPTNMATGAATLGSGTPDVDAEALGPDHRARGARRGIHLAFAPAVDVNNNPSNPVINVRSYGEDPAAVARLGAAFVRGVQAEGVAAVAKHFPGHGDTDADSHVAAARGAQRPARSTPWSSCRSAPPSPPGWPGS
jgi:beta-N-acetylhexosaminidase